MATVVSELIHPTAVVAPEVVIAPDVRVGPYAVIEGPVEIGPAVMLDTRAHRVTVDGEEIALTRKEFDLLSLLASDPGATRTREEILEQVWDAHWYGPTKTLDVHVASLRRKLGDPTLVETVRGVGFRLRTSVGDTPDAGPST